MRDGMHERDGCRPSRSGKMSTVVDGGNAGRTFNTKRNILYGLMQVITSRVLPFIVRTVLNYRFGVEYLGLNSLFASIFGVLSLMELGFGSAVVYSLYRPVAEGDTELICAYLSHYRKVYRLIGIAILVVGLTLIPFLGFFVHESTPPGGLNLQLCYLLFLGDTAISYLLFGYMTAIPLAHQRRDILSRVDMAVGVLQCLVRCTLLMASDNFYLYLASFPVVTVVRNLVTATVVRRRYPQFECKGSLDDVRRRDLAKRVNGLMVDRLASVARNGTDALCISAFIGLAANGKYSNYYYIMTSVVALSTTLLNSMSASVGNSIATTSREKNYRDMRKFDFIYMGFAGWATTCMLCLCQPFVRVWLGDSMMLDMPIVLALCAYLYILKTGDIRWVYHEGAGLWYEGRPILVGETVANVILNIVLCRTLGLLGIVLSTEITVFATNLVFFPKLLFERYFQNGMLREYLQNHALYAATMLVSACTSWLICENALPMGLFADGSIVSGVIALCGRLAICTMASASVFWLAWHRSKMYGIARGWMRDFVRTRG